MTPTDEAREDAVQRAQLAAFYHALTAVGLWPAPVPDTWWVQWSYRALHRWLLDPEAQTMIVT
jgi:hypothetical protein